MVDVQRDDEITGIITLQTAAHELQRSRLFVVLWCFQCWRHNPFADATQQETIIADMNRSVQKLRFAESLECDLDFSWFPDEGAIEERLERELEQRAPENADERDAFAMAAAMAHGNASEVCQASNPSLGRNGGGDVSSPEHEGLEERHRPSCGARSTNDGNPRAKG